LLDAGRKAVALNPDNWSAHDFVAVALEDLYQPLEAIPEYQKAIKLSQSDTDAIAALAHVYAATG
jgi:Flp pilus assembly protein TadD